MLLMVFLFAVGSAMCGAAPTMNFLIAARGTCSAVIFFMKFSEAISSRSAAIQGIGSGGIASLTQIIISDLVPLQQRGTFNGLIAM